MHMDRLGPVAKHLIAGYLDTGTYSRQFRDDHESPPSLMAKVHHMRSVIQARFVGDADFDLSPSYADYGRVEFTELESGDRFLLKSAKAVAIESATREGPGLFPVANLIRPSDVQVVVYRFRLGGLELSIAPASTRGRSEKLHVAAEPVLVGVWPYEAADLHEDEDAKPFDQDARDTFGDIGDLGHDESAGGFE